MLAAILFLLFTLLFINIFIICRLRGINRTDITRRLRDASFGTVCLTAAAIAILFAKDRRIAYFAFTFYYISFAWYVMMICRFSIIYSGYKLSVFRKSPLFWIAVAESAALIWGMFSESFFTIAHARWFDRIYWISRNYSAFYVYAVISGVSLAAALIVLMTAVRRVAAIYKPRYFGIAMLIAVMSVCCLISRFRQQPIAVHAICLALGETFIAYMAVCYAPRKLHQRAMQFVADKLNDGIVLYDDEHQLQLISEGYSAAVGLTGIHGIENEEAYWKEMTATANVENAWNGHVKSFSRDDTAYYYEIRHMPLNENGKLIGTVYWIRNVTESIENYRQMVRRANFDELTGIYNEAHFHERIKKVLEDNPGTIFVMVCASVEKFRVFRELFGREVCEDYLLRMARELRAGFSHITNCRYARAGEADFYIMMPKEAFVPKQFLSMTDKVAGEYSTSNFDLKIKTGVYEITDPALSMLSICNKALMACDAIKGDYRKRMMWFDENIQREAVKRERYDAELSTAIENGEMQIYLQPQVDENGRVIGAEALARWIHKEEGFITPAQFIPYFEMNGRITELDVCIWRQACQKLKEWKEKGRDDLYISVNISAKDLYALDIYEHYISLIREYGIDAKNLKLEITESAVINDLEQHVSLVAKLQEAGFEVEMDDFGSAYSSFNMLKDICVDVLKIDMKFLGETANEERSHIILKSIVDLSKALNMKTVAEGVETLPQLEFLKNAGCNIYQGYYFSKPMSVADFEKKYIETA